MVDPVGLSTPTLAHLEQAAAAPGPVSNSTTWPLRLPSLPKEPCSVSPRPLFMSGQTIAYRAKAANWSDAKRRVLHSYRDWIRAAPQIQTMYNLPLPVSVLRTRIRQEYERSRYMNKLPVIDVLLAKSGMEYQETMNFWKQTTHVMSYFKEENFRGEKRLPSSFMSGFLEGRN